MKKGMLVCFGLAFFVAFSMEAKDDWYEGVIVMKNRDVHVGTITLNNENNLISLKEKDKQFCFSAYQVASFNYHDEELGVVRKFISLPHKGTAGRYTDVFFEVIIKNEVSLLRRKCQFQDNDMGQINTGSIAFYSPETSNYDYYFEYKGIIVSSNRFKKEMKPLLDMTMSTELSGFIKDNRLNLNRTYDQIIVIRFFNKMASSNSPSLLTSY